MDIHQIPEAHYGEPGPLRDRLVAAVLNGEKTGTSALAYEYEIPGEEEPLPAVGDREIVIDSAGKPVCITEVTSVEVLPLKDITLQHAIDEGEGFASIEEWKKVHLEFWTSDYFKATLGESYQEPTGEMLIVYTHFKAIS